MNSNLSATTTSASSTVVTGALGIIALLLIVGTLFNIKLPLITSDRTALIALVLVGIAMCTSGGIGRSLELYGWEHPITLIGIVAGVLILAITLLTLAGVQLPLITTDRAAFIAVAVIAAIKVLVMFAGRFVA